MAPVFITGGTGYIGRHLIKKLVALGYDVTAVVRKGSENKLPKGVRAIIADPFDASTFQKWIKKGSVFVQLLGVSHPTPHKKEWFGQIDLRSVKASADAAATVGVSHFIYISVAMMESKRMKDFQQVRKEGEAYIFAKGLRGTFIRPWYVLGAGHWWGALLFPVYAIAALRPKWKKKAKGFSLVTLNQMLKILLKAIESPAPQRRIVEVQHIKLGILPAI